MALLTNINGKFSVSDVGAVTFNNAFTFPTADGAANYVLQTNGSGQLAWALNGNGDISGSGTANTVTKFTGAKTIGNGPITFSSNESTFTGRISVTGDISADNYINIEGATNPYLRIQDITNEEYLNLYSSDNESAIVYTQDTFKISSGVDFLNQTPRLTINSSGNATFTGTVTAPTFLGDLNGTINTVTTATTKGNSTNDTTVATTAFVQNVIGTIPAGLVFQGTWNASTNSPTLTSGSGTTGHFYIVSVAGTTNLDGITDWQVGDWAVFIEQGASDQWEKIDNSSVLSGSGTGGSFAGWSGSGTSVTLGNAPVTFSGNNSTFSGNITSTATSFVQTFNVTDNSTFFNINHSGNENWLFKCESIGGGAADFITIGASGGGKVAFGEDGSAIFEGSVGVGTSSASSFYPGTNNLVVGSGGGESAVTVYSGTTNTGYLLFADGTSGSDTYRAQVRYNHNTDSMEFAVNGISTSKLTINSSGNATFAGKVGIGGKIPTYGITLAQGTGDNNKIAWTDATPDFAASIYASSSTDKLTFATKNASNVETTALEIDTSQNATFAGNVGIGGAPDQKLTLKDSGNLYMHIDRTSGAQVYLGATDTEGLLTTSNSFPFIFKTNNTTAITIDTSQNATFAGNVGIGGSPTFKLDVLSNGTSLRLNSSDANGSYVTWSNNGTANGFMGSGYHLWSSPNNIATTLGIRAQTRLDLGIQASVHMTILSSGNVGIGTTSPSSYDAEADDLVIYNAVTPGITIALPQTTAAGSARGSILFSDGTSGNEKYRGGVIYDHGTGMGGVADTMYIRSAVNNYMVLGPTGNVGIGTKTPQAALTVAHDLSNGGDATGFRLNAASGTTSNTLFGGPVSSGDYAFFQSYKEGTSAGVRDLSLNPIGGNVGIGTTSPLAKLSVADGDIEITGANAVSRQIRFMEVGVQKFAITNVGSDDSVRFYTAVGGDILNLKDGKVGIGTVSPTYGKITVTESGSAYTGDYIYGGTNGSYGALRCTLSASNGPSFIDFFRSSYSNTVPVGAIVTSGSNCLYQSYSDYRMKENVSELTGALDKVNNIQPKTFNYKEDTETTYQGFIAHELQEIVPQAVSGKKDEVNEDGTPKYQGVDNSHIVPLLVAAVQEQQEIIQSLKQRIEQLEN